MATEAADQRAGTRSLPIRWRVPLLVLGMLSLLAGIGAGLLRLGWAVPLPRLELAAVHGPLMVAAFFGTVIGLERAVALGRVWGFLAPAASGLGGIALLAGAPAAIAMALLFSGGLLLALATVRAAQRQPALHTQLLALAAALLATASLAWWWGSAAAATASWMAFLVLTIAGERLELSRFLPPSPIARRIFLGIVVLQLVALVVILFDASVGERLFGLSLAALAVWLLRQDVARRTVRQAGLTGFIARCLLSGYFWLLFGGMLLLVDPPLPFVRDAALHAVFVGFVLAMVFGHAPIIFPAILRVKLPYHGSFHLPLVLLHASLLLRVAGDLAGLPEWRAWGGAGNALCIAVFILTMLAAAVRGRAGGESASPDR